MTQTAATATSACKSRQNEVAVVDTAESSIESRESATQAFQKLGAGTLKGLLIYIPAKPPITDEQKQVAPFALYAECGAQFPNPAVDSDEYQNLCLKAKPEYSAELQQIFKDDPSPLRSLWAAG